jgi:hypothetical protein
MNAIYLLASYFSQLKWASDLEQKLLAQAVHDITVALDQSDRLVDIVQASSLLAVYLYANNRILEGYSRAYSAAKLAVNLGLHQITSDFHAHQTYKSGPLGQMSATVLPPPRDLLELRDRISVFWQAFMVDRCWSVANGLPVALPHGNRIQFRINTPWPRPDTEQIFHVSICYVFLAAVFEKLQQREGADVDHDTVRGLLDQNPSVPATPCLPAFRAKAAALYEYTSRLASGIIKLIYIA